jgi:glycosyltransferase involved in cell wall biosynthesis
VERLLTRRVESRVPGTSGVDSPPVCEATHPDSRDAVADDNVAAARRSAVSVLLITPRFSTKGGIQSYCQTLVPSLEHRVEVFFIGPASEREGRIRRMARAVLDIVRLFLRYRRKDIDVVHINSAMRGKPVVREGVALLLAKLHATKALVFFHGWSVDFEQLVRKRFNRLFRKVFGQADMIIVLSKDFERSLRELGIATRIAVERTFYFDGLLGHISEEQIRARVMDGGRPFTTLFLSRVMREKGIYTTIDAHALLRRRHPNARLLVAGDGDELDSARKHTEANGIEGVTFLGYMAGDAKRDVFMDSDVLVLPTMLWEGLPISIVEAMRCGLPVITRPVGGIRDIFQDELMGWLVPSSEPADYCKVLTRAAEDPDRRLQIGLYNRAYAIRHFSSGSAGKRMSDYYASICAA